MTRIIGIDPGLANTGYGIIETEGSTYRCNGHGVIRTNKDLPSGERLLIIGRELEEIIRRHHPDQAGIEDIFFAKNAATAIPVAQAKGVILMTLARHGIPAGEYPPQAIKQAIVGRGRADKGQIQELVKILLGLDTIPKPDHAADALAVAICRANSIGFSQVLAKSGHV